jgi:phage-related holin
MELINEKTKISMTKTMTAIIFSMTGFFAPLTTAFVVAISMVIMDTITKLMAVGKTEGISSIKSKKLFQVIPKSIFYMVFIILGQLCHDYIDVNIPFSKLVLVGIIGIETYSIDENFEQMTGYSFIKKILKFAQNITSHKMKK